MTIAIGRAGLDTTMDDPQTQEITGRQIRWSGWFQASTLEAAKTLRQQLVGYVDNPDELWVPVVCGHDVSFNGFYRVLDASVGADPAMSYYNKFVFPWSVTVEAVPGFAMPLLESVLTGALRTNVSSITAANMVAYFMEPGGSIPGSTASMFYAIESRTGADGVNGIFFLANPTLPVTIQFGTPATGSAGQGWYPNAALLESQALDGATYRKVVGRQLPYRDGVADQGTDWRLSNGYIRVAPAVTTGAQNLGCDITVAHYDGSQWDTAVRYTFTVGGTGLGAGGFGYGQVAVLRNDPACVSIRLTVDISNIFYSLDLTVRRGSRLVECRWTPGTGGVVIVARQTVEAATAITGGIRATSNDASGNRYVLASPMTTTNDLVNGKITSNSVAAYDFMIGSEVGGSGAAGQSVAQQQIYQYMCAQSEVYRLVGR